MQVKKSFADSYSTFEFLKEKYALLEHPDFTLYATIIAVVVVLFTAVILRLLSKSKSGKNVLIVGLSEAGKTLIFTRLVSQKFVKTVTSMNRNEADVSLNNKNVTVIDLPGYERLRDKFWDDFKNSARGVIFVVDSSQFMANMRDVAEFLYNVLADPIISKRKVPLLIACNKQDAPKAKSSKVIQNQLEKEINAIRETRKSALSFTDETNVSQKIIGDGDKEFQFNDLKFKIEFVDCSALGKEEGEADLNQVCKWLTKAV